MGDSFAFGWGIEKSERFSNLLEQKLNSQNTGKYEVYNTSIPGWESKNQLEFLKQRAGMFNFDIIILSYILNGIYNDRAFKMDSYSPKLIRWRSQAILKPILNKSFSLEFFFSKDPYPIRFAHQKLNRFFKANNIQAIDLYNHLKGQPANKLKVNPFDTHPSPFVHQIAAELLFSSLSSP